MTKKEVLINMVNLHTYLYEKVKNGDYDDRLDEIDVVYQEVYASWEYQPTWDIETVIDI